MDTFLANVSRVTDLTHNVREITLRLVEPPRLQFHAGQFISFHIDRPGSRFGVTRAYTIASPPDEDRELLLLLDLVPEGSGSGFLYGLKEGDETKFRGPFGDFQIGAGSSDLLLVANGTGIAPFRSMLFWLAAHQPKRPVTLLWGLKSERDLYYQDAWRRLNERFAGFRSVIALSEPGNGWSGFTGPVTSLVEAEVASVENLEVFLCGSTAMVTEVAAAIKNKGTCPIHKEPYFAATT